MLFSSDSIDLVSLHYGRGRVRMSALTPVEEG
jgi:hypothetical protein